ncbi:MAG: hypothetical protein CMO80_23520 [Verrucomicrobiales bacterium]|nr:hypothetical protein [Verrucomicrobiales bacterium]
MPAAERSRRENQPACQTAVERKNPNKNPAGTAQNPISPPLRIKTDHPHHKSPKHPFKTTHRNPGGNDPD